MINTTKYTKENKEDSQSADKFLLKQIMDEHTVSMLDKIIKLTIPNIKTVTIKFFIFIFLNPEIDKSNIDIGKRVQKKGCKKSTL